MAQPRGDAVDRDWELFCGAGFLVAVVHEGAAAALGAQVGIADGRAALGGVESMGQTGVRFEFGRAAVELARVAEDHSGPAVHGLDNAANLDVHVAIFSELTDLVAILIKTDDGEAALLV
jgi:hypothetical protein